MRRYWLIFAQAVTVCLGILFVVTTLRPDLLRLAGPAAAPAVQAAVPAGPPATRAAALASYADGVARAAPSVVNVYTTKLVNVPLIPCRTIPSCASCSATCPAPASSRPPPAWARA